jgi:hypothetical protein
MPHCLEPLIKSTGLRRACLYHDVWNALHRCTLNGNDRELETLTDEQILMFLVLTNQGPETPAWARAEKHLGRTLPKE